MIASSSGKPLPRLHLVTNERLLREPWFLEVSARLMEAGTDRIALHLRGRGLSGREMWDLAVACSEICRATASWLVINDRVDVAAGVGATAVQLGQGSMQPSMARKVFSNRGSIGVSIHNVEEAAAAVRDGADFLLAGTLYPSSSHPHGPAAGVDWLPELLTLGRPVLGIGGIGERNVREVLARGAAGVGVISAVWDAPEPRRAVENLLQLVE